jgi:hypothetical protein
MASALIDDVFFANTAGGGVAACAGGTGRGSGAITGFAATGGIADTVGVS